MQLWSALFTLVLVLDPLGNLPVCVSLMKSVPEARRRRVLAREALVALVALMLFLFFGPQLLALMGVSGPAVRIGGGVIFFLLALRMIFPDLGSITGDSEDTDREPFIVPIAIPLMAGPSALASVTLLSNTYPGQVWMWLGAVLGAWIIASVVLLFAPDVHRLIGQRGELVTQRLMGTLLVIIGVHMIMTGVSGYFPLTPNPA
ncbi:MAG: MarC family protein [Polyangiaceae bacterium]